MVKFALPFPLGDSTDATDAKLLRIPLVRSADAAAEDARLTISSPVGLAVTLVDGGDWIADEFSGKRDSSIRFRASNLPPSIELSTRAITPRQSTPAIAEKTYIQTWMSKTQRQDRAVYRLSTVSGPLRVLLPDGVSADETRVLIDGQSVSADLDGEGWLVVNPPDASAEQLTLELSYRFLRRPGVGRMELGFPRIEGARWNRQLFWQFVIPANEHLLSYPGRLASEDNWKRRGLVFQRRPGHAQPWLERWTDATPQPVPQSSNVYLASGFGNVSTIQAATVDRRLLLLAASGLTILLGLVWRILGWTSNPWWTSSLAITGLMSLWLNPPLTILVAQAAGFGVLLVVVARILDWWLEEKSLRSDSRRPSANHSGGTVYVSSGSSRVDAFQSTETKPVSMAAPDH